MKGLLFKVIEEISLKNAYKKAVNDGKSQTSRQKYEISIKKSNKKSKTDVVSGLESILKDINIKDKDDIYKLIFEFKTETLSNENIHNQYISFNISENLSKLSNEDFIKWIRNLSFEKLSDLESEFYCDCKSYKYHHSKINKNRGSFYIGEYNKNEMKYTTKGYYSVNPKKKGGLCKHLMSDINYIEYELNDIKKEMKDTILSFFKNEKKKLKDKLERILDGKDSYDDLSIFNIWKLLKERDIKFSHLSSKKKLIDKLLEYDKKYEDISKKLK